MSNINQINFLGFSNVTTPNDPRSSSLSLLYPYYNLSHDQAGYVENYNPNPIGIDVLKHYKLYVGSPQQTKATDALVNLDTYDLYHGCYQHSKKPTDNTTIAGSKSEGLGSPEKGLPVRFQKIHFMARTWDDESKSVDEAEDLREYYAYLPIADPMLLGDYGSEDVDSELGELGATKSNWIEKDGVGDPATEENYKKRLIIGSDWKYEDPFVADDEIDCTTTEFNNLYAVCIRDRDDGAPDDWKKYRVDLNEIAKMTLKKLIDLVSTLQEGGNGEASFVWKADDEPDELVFSKFSLSCNTETGEIEASHDVADTISTTDCPEEA